MNSPGKIMKLDEVVVNRIAAGEVIQRPSNALKELIENSLDAKSTSIQVTVKEGGLKLLQIQDNGTGIRKDDMEIVCERFTTSKLQKFEDLRSISTYGFRGEALASISHISLLTITTKTADEQCAYKASYIDSKLKAPPKSCAGNQGTTIMIENLFYNVATRRKALGNPAEEFSRITDVVTKYAIHNPTVGFLLKKSGGGPPQVRTTHTSTKQNNISILYGNPVFRELLEIELSDETYKFKMHALITNPNYGNKKMVFILFINHRLVESTSIRKMLEDLYSFYIPKKTHPWCYISLEINPANVDVNVHPTKHEVRFLNESLIIEKMRFALDERLSGSGASRTFYLQARLPQANITKEVLGEVLPEYEKDANKLKKTRAHELIRTDSSDQKLDKFNFTIHAAMKHGTTNSSLDGSGLVDDTREGTELIESANSINVNTPQQNVDEVQITEMNDDADVNITPRHDTLNDSLPLSIELTTDFHGLVTSTQNGKEKDTTGRDSMGDFFEAIKNDYTENAADDTADEELIDVIAEKARKRVYQYFGNKTTEETNPKENDKETEADSTLSPVKTDTVEKKNTEEFKSYSVNTIKKEIQLTSILKLRKEVEDDCHEGLKKILSDLTFIGCIDESSALIQSGVNLYLCNTAKLAEELFYEIMLYDFSNYGIIKFSDLIPLYDLAMLALYTTEAGWTEDDGPKEELATNVKELLLEKTDLLKEYFSITIDKHGNLVSLPIILDKYFPHPAGLPLYILRLSTEVEWRKEQPCFQTICRETAKYYSQMNPIHNTHDWKYITEHVLYPAIKESLIPPKHFAHDSTILQIASLPALYKVFERC